MMCKTYDCSEQKSNFRLQESTVTSSPSQKSTFPPWPWTVIAILATLTILWHKCGLMGHLLAMSLMNGSTKTLRVCNLWTKTDPLFSKTAVLITSTLINHLCTSKKIWNDNFECYAAYSIALWQELERKSILKKRRYASIKSGISLRIRLIAVLRIIAYKNSLDKVDELCKNSAPDLREMFIAFTEELVNMFRRVSEKHQRRRFETYSWNQCKQMISWTRRNLGLQTLRIEELPCVLGWAVKR